MKRYEEILSDMKSLEEEEEDELERYIMQADLLLEACAAAGVPQEIIDTYQPLPEWVRRGSKS